MRKITICLLIAMMCMCFAACEETEEGVDNENDIIVRNWTDDDLYIMIDGSQRGEIENDGVAKTMWDDIPDGTHLIQAYYNDDYTGLYCQVTTDYLDGDEDFAWYLYDNDEYGGTKDGDC